MIRYQQKRGVKLPPGARSVARPSRWGNPYKVGAERRFRSGKTTLVDAISWYRRDATLQVARHPEWLDPLRGASGLACYCPLDQPCHADILIELLDQ